MMKVINKKIVAKVVLMISLFLNPFGYDGLFYLGLQITGNSYVITTLIFYLLALLSFGVYFFYRNNWFLALAVFLNPLGFDIVFYTIYGFVGSYFHTTIVLYLLTFIFLGIYFILEKINPIKHIKNKVKLLFNL